MVVHVIPAHRVVALLESLTGAAPSVGFVHGMINRAAGLLTETHQRIRALITLAHAVCCDETPLRVGPRQPPAGKKKAERYLLVACTELYTHYLLGDRSMATFTAFVLTDLTNSVIVHDRYQTMTSPSSGRWSTSSAVNIFSGILPVPPRSTPTRTGQPRSPRRCAT
jgi:transposase